MDLPNTRLWRDDPRPMASSPLIVIPVASSVPSCSERVKVWPGKGGECGKIGATANLDALLRAAVSKSASRDEETALKSNKETDEGGRKMSHAAETALQPACSPSHQQ